MSEPGTPLDRPGSGDAGTGDSGAQGAGSLGARTVRVGLPEHLRTLAELDGEVRLSVPPPVTQRAVLDALEARFPVLRGTIRRHGTLERRPFVRYFACRRDLSHAEADEPLPAAVAAGEEPFLIIGAMAGG